MDGELQGPPDELWLEAEKAAILHLMRSRIGSPVQHREWRFVRKLNAGEKRVLHTKHTLSIAGAAAFTMAVFARPLPQGRRKTPIAQTEAFLGKTDFPQFRTPKFLGTVSSTRGDVGIWEFVPGINKPFRSLSRDDVKRVARAVGAMNARTADATAGIPDLRDRGGSIGPLALEVSRLARSMEHRMAADLPWRQAVDAFVAAEPSIHERARAIGAAFFGHQDINTANCLFGQDDDLWIVDWESAALCPLGAGLRNFAASSEETMRHAIRSYVDYMKGEGFSLTPDDVTFMAHVNYSYHFLARSIRGQHKKGRLARRWLELSLAHFVKHNGILC
jgi:hypothetical protein